MIKSKDTIRIKDWADEKYEEYKKTIQEYINNGIDKVIAIKMVLKDSMLGAGYKAQLRRDFNLSIFD